jgi:signal transduction histidine kinase
MSRSLSTGTPVAASGSSTRGGDQPSHGPGPPAATAAGDAGEHAGEADQVWRLASAQSALRRVSTLVARGATPEQVFQAVAAEAGKLLGVSQASTIHYDGELGVTVGRWSRGTARGFEVGAEVPLTDPDSLTAHVARTGSAGRIDDYNVLHSDVARQMQRLGYRSSVAAPITVDGHTWGALLVASDKPEPLGSEAEQRLAEFTELVALALESAQAHADLTASRARIVSVGDTERKRVERNLHDGVQQRLLALTLQLRLAQSRVSEDAESAEQLIDEAIAELQVALEELREVARGLHPAILSERGLGAALQSLAAHTPFPIELTGASNQRLPEPVEEALYYVVSESLTNAAKHASPSRATVVLGIDGETASVEVRDDGAGGAEIGHGTGLQGLADRIDALGGRFTLTSPKGEGTLIRAELPRRQAGVNRIAHAEGALPG